MFVYFVKDGLGYYFVKKAAIVHLQELISVDHFNAGNALTIIPDLLGPITMIVLGLLTIRAKNNNLN